MSVLRNQSWQHLRELYWGLLANRCLRKTLPGDLTQSLTSFVATLSTCGDKQCIKYTGTLKDWGYIVGYQIDKETIILLFIKTPKNIFSYSVSQCDNNSTYTMSFNISGGGCFTIRKSEMRFSLIVWKVDNRAYKQRR